MDKKTWFAYFIFGILLMGSLVIADKIIPKGDKLDIQEIKYQGIDYIKENDELVSTQAIQRQIQELNKEIEARNKDKNKEINTCVQQCNLQCSFGYDEYTESLEAEKQRLENKIK